MKDQGARFMRECFALAERGTGHVSPNPRVGAVIVESGRVVASGFHERFGGPHAEVNCLRRYRGTPSLATMYINLEPCSHQGKTPPCADAIVESGIRKVVVAMNDPNPLVAGRGIRRLRKAGVKVEVGLLAREARWLNRRFVKQMTTGLPYVHLKVAQSLDGFIAGPHSSSRWISSMESRRLVHRWRAEHDAVLIGAGTVAADDPRLSVRHVKGRNPAIVILDGRCSVPLASRVLSDGRQVLLYVDREMERRKAAKIRALCALGATVVGLKGKGLRFSVRHVLDDLSQRGIASVLVEGGSQVFSQSVAEGLVDEMSIFIAPTFLGAGVRAFAGMGKRSRKPFKPGRMTAEAVGSDILIKFYAASA